MVLIGLSALRALREAYVSAKPQLYWQFSMDESAISAGVLPHRMMGQEGRVRFGGYSDILQARLSVGKVPGLVRRPQQ